MPDKILPIQQVLALLAGAPPRLAALTAGLTPAQLRLSPAPGEWSANRGAGPSARLRRRLGRLYCDDHRPG